MMISCSLSFEMGDDTRLDCSNKMFVLRSAEGDIRAGSFALRGEEGKPGAVLICKFTFGGVLPRAAARSSCFQM